MKYHLPPVYEAWRTCKCWGNSIPWLGEEEEERQRQGSVTQKDSFVMITFTVSFLLDCGSYKQNILVKGGTGFFLLCTLQSEYHLTVTFILEAIMTFSQMPWRLAADIQSSGYSPSSANFHGQPALQRSMVTIFITNISQIRQSP